MLDKLMYQVRFLVLGAQNPGALANNILNSAIDLLLMVAGGYAAVQFIFGCFSFMSKEPQKHSQGKDHMVHACIGLVGAFCATTVMAYLQTETKGFTGMIMPLMQLIN
jgi:hypothetical protein